MPSVCVCVYARRSEDNLTTDGAEGFDFSLRSFFLFVDSSCYFSQHRWLRERSFNTAVLLCS